MGPNNQHIHFIAIGGSAMHNLAIALHHKGYTITGSDDEIFDPARSRLAALGLLPAQMGWFPEKLDSRPEAVILGMHARADNPELARAKELGLQIFSYPEYLYEQSKDKLRIVIGGSHGKTTITAMCLHVLRACGVDCDYMVGAKLDGFDVMVRLTHEAKAMIFEGDEYLTSALDPRPKFHVYKPNVALVSGIAWDHVNVFPTFEQYVDQFRKFLALVPSDGSIFYCSQDETLSQLAQEQFPCRNVTAYGLPPHEVRADETVLLTSVGEVPLKVFGPHNLLNLEAARKICHTLGVSDAPFYDAIRTFAGAANRLEKIYENQMVRVFRDFAHAPSKLKATITAVKQQYPKQKLIACFELHTFSSMSKAFLPQYAGSMHDADVAVVYFSPHALELKKLPMLLDQDIESGFSKVGLKVFSNKQLMAEYLKLQLKGKCNLLLMSSGNFDGLEWKQLLDD